MLVSYVSSVVGSSDLDAIEAADELAVQPAFDAVCMAELEQSVVASPDDRIDPRRRPVVGGLGAERDHVGEGGVGGDVEAARNDDFPEAARKMEDAQGQDKIGRASGREREGQYG